ncbi:MAG TPA: hypothetical protein PK686_01455 [bacterium]|nr:hypothetical protein [bacterium]HPV65334.1 hypothetical protein [bacterium]
MKTILDKRTVREVVKLFEHQINTLASLDVPASIMADPLISLMELKEKLIIRTVELISDCEPDKFLWFVPVIPLNVIDISIQSQFLQFNGNKGCTYFKNEDVLDLVNTPSEPYYLLNVSENGFCRDEGKFLTVAESIAFCLHSNALERFYIKSANSRFVSLKEKPVIHIYRGEHPKIDWDYFENGESDNFLKGSEPYCLERVF